jgi:hypothetical protein
MRKPSHIAKPWYREPWPWILMAAPVAAIVGGVVTAWLAFASADGLVADDYYKRGLGINQALGKERAALAAGISVSVERDARRIRVRLRGVAPPALFVQLVHATRAGYDQRLRLVAVASGIYEAELPPLEAGRWRVIVDDPRGEWRIVKDEL